MSIGGREEVGEGEKEGGAAEEERKQRKQRRGGAEAEECSRGG